MSAQKTGRAATKSSSTSAVSFAVTVLLSRKTSRVLFLEAGKDFVDKLISFLLLPVGIIFHMLSEGVQGKPLGGISSIYKSVENMDTSFLHVDKEHLVQPRLAAASMSASTVRLLGMEARTLESLPDQEWTLPTVYYQCSCCTTISSTNEARCTSTRCTRVRCEYSKCSYTSGPYTVCADDVRKQESNLLKLQVISAKVGSSYTGQGFVKESVTYLVTDKLEIMPSTTIRSITVLNKLEVGNIADLESTDITVTSTQILQLLQAALTSSTCLNDVFGKK